MIKLLLKHYIYEQCINLIFNNIKNNFYKKKKFKYVKGKIYEYIIFYHDGFIFEPEIKEGVTKIKYAFIYRGILKAYKCKLLKSSEPNCFSLLTNRFEFIPYIRKSLKLNGSFLINSTEIIDWK